MKYYLKFIAFMVAVFFCLWLFNHVSPWLSIGAFMVLAGLVIHLIFNPKSKTNEK